MKSFTRGRVFKSNTVEVSTPRLLKSSSEGFERLSLNLAVISTDLATDAGSTLNNQSQILTMKHLGWNGNSEQLNNCLDETDIRANEKIDEAEVYAQGIIQEAEIKAGETIRQSQIEAEEIIQRAKAEETRLRAELAHAVRLEVEPLARSEGYKVGMQKAEIEGHEITEQAKALFRLAQRALQEEYAKVDNDLLELAMRIAERLARITLGLKPQQILDIIKSLMLLPQERDGWRLQVALEDADWILSLPPADRPPCSLVKNETLSRGDCFLECQEGIYDARFEAQLERLEKVLREELKNGELEASGSEGRRD